MRRLLLAACLGIAGEAHAQGTPEGASTPHMGAQVEAPVAAPPADETSIPPESELGTEAAAGLASAASAVPAGFCLPSDLTLWTNAGLVPQEIFKTLMIVHPSVVDSSIAHHSRPWRFEHAVRNLAGGHHVGKFVYQWLRTFESSQDINGFLIPARSAIREKFIEVWKAKQGIPPGPNTDAEWIANMDLTKAPVQLVAVVNRIDLAKVDRDEQGQITRVENAGEGRLVYQVVNDALPAAERSRPFTIIFEYELAATTVQQLRDWATAWENLKTRAHGTAYNNALAEIVRRFAVRDARLDRPNNIPLNQIRTNEIELASPWQLREFKIGGGGLLSPSTVALTPDLSFNADQEKREALLDFVEGLNGTPLEDLLEFQVANGDTFVVPTFIEVDDEETNFLGGSSETEVSFLDTCAAGSPTDPFCAGQTPKRQDGITWLIDAPGSDSLPDLPAKDSDRRWFSFNTCNGCHGGDGGDARDAMEKPNVSRGTLFTHIDLRKAGRKPPPLTNLPNVPDTVLSEFLCKNDLPLRRRGLMQLINMPDAAILSAFNIATSKTADDRSSCAIEWDPRSRYNAQWMGCFFRERQQRVH